MSVIKTHNGIGGKQSDVNKVRQIQPRLLLFSFMFNRWEIKQRETHFSGVKESHFQISQNCLRALASEQHTVRHSFILKPLIHVRKILAMTKTTKSHYSNDFNTPLT